MSEIIISQLSTTDLFLIDQLAQNSASNKIIRLCGECQSVVVNRKGRIHVKLVYNPLQNSRYISRILLKNSDEI